MTYNSTHATHERVRNDHNMYRDNWREVFPFLQHIPNHLRNISVDAEDPWDEEYVRRERELFLQEHEQCRTCGGWNDRWMGCLRCESNLPVLPQTYDEARDNEWWIRRADLLITGEPPWGEEIPDLEYQ